MLLVKILTFLCNISMHLSTLLPRAPRRSQVQSACPIDLYFLRIPVNKGTNSRIGWTEYSNLYEIVHPSVDFISLCLLTGAECKKVLLNAFVGV